MKFYSLTILMMIISCSTPKKRSANEVFSPPKKAERERLAQFENQRKYEESVISNPFEWAMVTIATDNCSLNKVHKHNENIKEGVDGFVFTCQVFGRSVHFVTMDKVKAEGVVSKLNKSYETVYITNDGGRLGSFYDLSDLDKLARYLVENKCLSDYNSLNSCKLHTLQAKEILKEKLHIFDNKSQQ